jgi:hypothetical protein
MTLAKLTVMGREIEINVEDAPVETPESVAWQTDQAEGWGDPREIAAAQQQLAAEVAAMDMRTYQLNRARLGTAGPNILDFLGGL